MRCSKCNELLPDDSVFCPFCGEALSSQNKTAVFDSERQRITESQRYFDSDFGISPDNPIVVSSAHMVGCYLKAFRTTDGSAVTWKHEEDDSGKDVIKYRLYVDDAEYMTVYFNAKGTDSKYMPKGLELNEIALEAAQKGVDFDVYTKELEKKRIETEEEEKKIAAKKAKQKKTRKRWIIIAAVFVLLASVAITAYLNRDFIKYTIANYELEKGDYDNAIDKYVELNGYKDSKNKICEAYYYKAELKKEAEEYSEAIAYYRDAGSFKDSLEKIKECQYCVLKKYIDEKEYEKAYNMLGTLGKYKDSYSLINLSLINLAKKMYELADYESGYFYLLKIKTEANTHIIGINDKDYVPVILDYIDYFLNNISEERSISRIDALLGYVSESNDDELKSRIKATFEQLMVSKYDYANYLFNQEEYYDAIQIYDSIIDYLDVKDKRLEAIYCYVNKQVESYKATENEDGKPESYYQWLLWRYFIEDGKGLEYAKELYSSDYKDGEELYDFVLEHIDD